MGIPMKRFARLVMALAVLGMSAGGVVAAAPASDGASVALTCAPFEIRGPWCE
jgi:hypothetical protein